MKKRVGKPKVVSDTPKSRGFSEDDLSRIRFLIAALLVLSIGFYFLKDFSDISVGKAYSVAFRGQEFAESVEISLLADVPEIIELTVDNVVKTAQLEFTGAESELTMDINGNMISSTRGLSDDGINIDEFDIGSEINNYCIGYPCTVPVFITSKADGIVTLSSIDIEIEEFPGEVPSLKEIVPLEAAIEDSWKVGTSTKKLEISEDLVLGSNRETIRNITTFIDDSELDALASGTASNTKGAAPYNQYLYLLGPGASVNSGYVVYAEDDNDVTADFLYFKSGTEIGRYLLEFTTALESDVDDSTGTQTSTGLYLTDFEDVEITMFGKSYTIIQARRTSTAGNNINLILMSGAVKDTLNEGATKTYTIDGKNYEVTLSFVDSDSARLTINGQQTKDLHEGESDQLSDGLITMISKILYQDYAGGVHSATFYLGKDKTELEDANIKDIDSTSSLKVNDKIIGDAYVILEGRDNNVTFKLDRIQINMTADDNFYVPINVRLSEIIEQEGSEQEVLFTNRWDIEYKGLKEEPIETVQIVTSGPSRYILEFKDGDGNEVSMPLAEAVGASLLEFGEKDKALINVENKVITKDDYLVLTDSSKLRGERKTYVLQYKGADKITADSPVLKFKNLGSGETIEQTYNDATPLATLKLGGADFRVYKAPDADISTNDFNIQVDLDADGTLESTGDFIPITTWFGAEMNITNGTDNRVDFTVKTPDDDKDENAKDIVETLQATDLKGYITANSGSVGLQRTDNLNFRTPDGQTNVAYAYTSYGAFITLIQPSTAPSTLKIEYPKNQREALVYYVVREKDTTPPEITITNPINDSKINSNSLWLMATTNEPAYCDANILYKYPTGDKTPPEISDAKPTGKFDECCKYAIEFKTNEEAECKGSANSDKSYESMDLTFIMYLDPEYSNEVDGYKHTYQADLKGNNTIYAKCKDLAGNINPESYSWSFEQTCSNPNIGCPGDGVGGGGSSPPKKIDYTTGHKWEYKNLANKYTYAININCKDEADNGNEKFIMFHVDFEEISCETSLDCPIYNKCEQGVCVNFCGGKTLDAGSIAESSKEASQSAIQKLNELGYDVIGNADLSGFEVQKSGNKIIFSSETQFDVFDQAFDSFIFVDKNGNMANVQKRQSSVQKAKPKATHIVELFEKPLLEEKSELEKKLEMQKASPQTIKEKLQQQLKSHEQRLKEAKAKALEEMLEVNPNIESKVVDEYQSVFNGFSVEITDSEALRIKELSAVKNVYRNEEVRALLEESVNQINADELWKLKDENGNLITGKGVTIGIIDTGVDYTHDDLGGCLGNNCKVIGGYDFVNNDNDTKDDHGHGTHVAATAAGNGILKGVAPDAKIVAYKVLDSGGSGSWSGIVQSIERSVDPNQDGDFSDHLNIISLSLGGFGNPDDPISKAIDNAVEEGVVAVIAAGNSGPYEQSIGSPGTARKAITVGAVDKCDNIATFSSRGPVSWENGILLKPDVVAPGVKICAAQFDDWLNDRACKDDKHIAISGTSMATPHVSGAAALLLQSHPDWTPKIVKSALMSTSLDLGLKLIEQGAGRMDLLEANGAEITTEPQSIAFEAPASQLEHAETIAIKNLINEELTLQLEIIELKDQNGIEQNFASLNVSELTVGKDSSEDISFRIAMDETAEGFFTGKVLIKTDTRNYIVPFVFEKLSKLTVKAVSEDKKLHPSFMVHDEALSNVKYIDFGDVAESLDGNSFTFKVPAGSYTAYAIGEFESELQYILMDTIEVPPSSEVEIVLNLEDARPFTVKAESLQSIPLKLYQWSKGFNTYNDESVVGTSHHDPAIGNQTIYISNKPDNNLDTDILLYMHGVPAREEDLNEK